MSMSSTEMEHNFSNPLHATNKQEFSNQLPPEAHRDGFPNRIPPLAHQDHLANKMAAREGKRDEFQNRVPPIAHQELFSNLPSSSIRRLDYSSRPPEIRKDVINRIPPEAHQDGYATKFLNSEQRENCPNLARTDSARSEELSSQVSSDSQQEDLSDHEEFSNPLSPDIDQDDYSNQLPADLSSQKDLNLRGLLTGVAHGVFGTGNGKTLPEMIQSGRNAGLPLYVRCPICQKEFKQKSTLLQHGCIHIESRPYPCGECGKRFRQQSHLTQHLRIHTNEKPYGCLYCGRNFRQRTILNQHVRIHTGEKPYKCAQCGKDFRQKAILDQHTRTHQGDRPYCCPLPNCRRRFAAEAEVKRHVENHVGPKRKPPPPGISMNPTPLVKPELYLPPQCYTHPGNFQQQYAMSQLLGSSPPQPTALVQ